MLNRVQRSLGQRGGVKGTRLVYRFLHYIILPASKGLIFTASETLFKWFLLTGLASRSIEDPWRGRRSGLRCAASEKHLTHPARKASCIDSTTPFPYFSFARQTQQSRISSFQRASLFCPRADSTYCATSSRYLYSILELTHQLTLLRRKHGLPKGAGVGPTCNREAYNY
jgi:hypothetical protein